MVGKLAKERTKAHKARCAENRMREQIGDVRAQRDAARKQRDLLMAELVKMVEFLEPMRFDRASDDAMAVELDKSARAAIASVKGGS